MISRAYVTNGFEVNGKVRYDVQMVFRGELPASLYNEETGRFEMVAEDIPYLIDDGLVLIGIEFDEEVAEVAEEEVEAE